MSKPIDPQEIELIRQNIMAIQKQVDRTFVRLLSRIDRILPDAEKHTRYQKLPNDWKGFLKT